MRKKNLFRLLFLSAIFTGGCGTASPFLTRSPNAPHPAPPPDQPAYIRIPVEVELPGPQTIGSRVAEIFKKGFPALTPSAEDRPFPLWIDPVSLNISGGKLVTELLVHFRAPTLKVDKNHEEKKGTVDGGGVTTVLSKVQSDFRWNSDWHLELFPIMVRPDKTIPEAADFVRRTGEDLLRQGARQFNESLRAFSNIKPQAAEMWDVAQEPVYLDKGIWLLIQPQRVGVGLMRASKTKIETVLEMEAYPRVIFGPEPAVQKKPLPPLKPFQPGPLGFHAISTLQIGFPEINRMLADSTAGIVGRTLKESGDFKAKVTSLNIFSLGGQVGVKALVEYNPIVNLEGGPSSLTLYLKGTPHYDAKKRRFEFPDLDFDLKTGDLLFQTAQWLLKSDMRDQLRKQAKVPMGPKLDEIKKRMDEVFNRPLGPHTDLTAKVGSLKVVDAFTDDKGFVAQVSLDGQATLNVSWK